MASGSPATGTMVACRGRQTTSAACTTEAFSGSFYSNEGEFARSPRPTYGSTFAGTNNTDIAAHASSHTDHVARDYVDAYTVTVVSFHTYIGIVVYAYTDAFTVPVFFKCAYINIVTYASSHTDTDNYTGFGDRRTIGAHA